MAILRITILMKFMRQILSFRPVLIQHMHLVLSVNASAYFVLKNLCECIDELIAVRRA